MSKNASSSFDPSYLKQFKGIHKGKRAFVLGNAPSLKRINLTFLKNDILFGVNKGAQAYSLGLPFLHYYVVSDPHVYRAYSNEIKSFLVGVRFYREDVIKTGNFSLAISPENVFSFNKDNKRMMLDGNFQFDITQNLYRGFTVVLDAIQIAAYMGFDNIYVIGVDLDYEQEDSHFYGSVNYEKLNINHMPVDFVLSSFKVAEESLKNRGIGLYNATPGGKLDTIERVYYETLF